MQLSWHYHGTHHGKHDTGSHKGCTWRPLDEHKRQDGQAGVLHVGLSVLAQVTCSNLQQQTQQPVISVTHTSAPFVNAAPAVVPGS